MIYYLEPEPLNTNKNFHERSEYSYEDLISLIQEIDICFDFDLLNIHSKKIMTMYDKLKYDIKFTNNGLIFYEDFIEIDKIKEFKNHNSHLESENIKYDIQKILNLNCNDLKEKRKVLIEAFKILEDMYQKNNVKVIASDAGITALHNGGTHMSFEDMGIVRGLAGSIVLEVTDEVMFSNILDQVAVKDGFYSVSQFLSILYIRIIFYLYIFKGFT